MGEVENTYEIEVKPEEVFKYIESIWNIKYHLSVSGINLNLEVLSENAIGIGAAYHWYGEILGVEVDFTEILVKRISNKRIHYQSFSGFDHNIILRLEPINKGTKIYS